MTSLSDIFGQDTAIKNSDEKTRIFGLAGFADALGGYIEYGYGYVDAVGQTDLSYHNATASFTRRYHGRLANSVRVIGNFGPGRLSSAGWPRSSGMRRREGSRGPEQ